MRSWSSSAIVLPSSSEKYAWSSWLHGQDIMTKTPSNRQGCTVTQHKALKRNIVCSPHVSSQLRLIVGEFLFCLIQLDVFVSRITFGGAKLLYLQSLTRHFTRSFPVLKHGHVPLWWLTLRNENLASILDVRNMPHFADPAWKEEFGATWVPSSENSMFIIHWCVT